jgi:signal transduction histidine kinase
VREALNRETTHFWENYAADPSHPAPNTGNLKGYLTEIEDEAGIPPELQGYGLGYHKVHGHRAHSLLYTSEKDGKRLHLLFDGQSVLRLAIFFGIFPLTIVLILIYVAAWWIYRESTVLLSPIIWLANKFDRFDPAHPDASLDDLSDIPGDVDWEIEKLVTSFSSYSRRIKQFVERERAFTRDASHEFRTPLTVIKIATDMLLSEKELDDYHAKLVRRIKGAGRDMEELIDAFLILARETDKEFEETGVHVASVVEAELRGAKIYLEDKPIKIEVIEEHRLVLNTAEKVLAIVLGNLIRNAVLYTNEGSVKITLRENSVEVSDTGIGMTEEQIKKVFQPYYRAESQNKTQRKGYGVGLTIVKRLSNRFNWQVEVESEVNVGSRFTVTFLD